MRNNADEFQGEGRGRGGLCAEGVFVGRQSSYYEMLLFGRGIITSAANLQ